MSQSASTNSVLPTSGSAAPDSQIVTLGEIWVAPAVDPDMTELLTDTLKPLLQPLSIEAAAVYLTTNPDENTLQLCVFVPGQDIEPQDYQLTLSQEHPHVRRALNSAEPALADWSALGEAERMRGPQEASGPEDRMARLCCPIRVDNIPQGLLVMSMPTSKVHQPQWLPAIGQQVAAIVEQSQHLGDTKAQCAQLQREVTLRDGLNQAALAVSGKRDPSEIFHAITTRLAGMGFVAAIHIPRDAPSTEAKPPFDVEIVAVATPDAQLLKELEDTVLKRPLIGLEFSPFPGIPDQVHVRQTDAQFIQLNIPEMVRELPAPYDALLEHVSASFALEGVIAAPLLGDDGVIATLLIAGSGLTPTDVPAVTAFARHASIAIQNARLQRQLQSDANRLHANVAARTAEVSQQKERLLAVLESAGSGIVITGPDGVMEYANPAWERLTGRSAATEIRNQVKIVDENTFPDLFSGRYGSRELTDRRPDGSGYSANVTVTPLFEKDKGGKRLGGLVVVYRDITEYKEIDRLKSQFLNTASHQLRTPLTTILGFSELLVSRPNLTQDERWRFLQHINDHAQRLKDLVEDLFDISQSESGGEIELDLSPLRLDTVLQKEIRLWQQKHPNHNYQLVHEGECPSVLADRDRLGKQVVRNLLSNATKYSSAGSTITITVTSAGKYLEVSVADQGIGMTQEEIQQAFDKFWRADASSTAVDGTGLGLVVARYILHLHEGQIWVESTPGKGTVVRFTLPAVGHEPTVLIVEDEEHVLEVEDNILRDDGLQTILTDNGEDAIQLAQKHRPDVILLDLMMPRVSGLEVLRALKAAPATTSIPVLIVSAKTNWKSIEETYKLGAVDFVAKPFEYDELLSRVRRALAAGKKLSTKRDEG